MEAERAAEENVLLILEVATFFVCATGTLALKVYHTVREPYMDEIFHIPQAQKFCEGDFTHWDPMITTLPGLYVSSVAVAQPLYYLFDVSVKLSCSVLWLRSINVVFALGNFVLLLLITRKLHSCMPGYDSGRALLNAVVLAGFPVLYFFSFLYYTDPGSTFFVLLMYVTSLYEQNLIAGLLGVAAILFRQTNVVWVFFIAGLAVAKSLRTSLQFDKKEYSTEQMSQLSFILTILQQLFLMLRTNKKGLLLVIVDIIRRCFPFILVGIGFVGFVVWNGSIVVGAKDDHPAGIHIPQILYFSAFTCAISFAHVISVTKVTQFVKVVTKRPMVTVALLAVSGVAVWKTSVVHRYLLADNRHYTFYIWSRVFSRHPLVRYLLLPGYLYSWWAILTNLNHRDILWKSVYLITIVINLVPMTLLEFRYFILPFLIYRLNIRLPSYRHLVVEGAVYFCINSVTIYLFLYKPFQWPNEPALQRFMW